MAVAEAVPMAIKDKVEVQEEVLDILVTTVVLTDKEQDIEAETINNIIVEVVEVQEIEVKINMVITNQELVEKEYKIQLQEDHYGMPAAEVVLATDIQVQLQEELVEEVLVIVRGLKMAQVAEAELLKEHKVLNIGVVKAATVLL